MSADTAFSGLLADLLEPLPATAHGPALAVIERHQGATLYINAEHARQARVTLPAAVHGAAPGRMVIYD